MKNKGFTLVELITVIVVLSLIMIVCVPSIQKALKNAKTGISDLNKKNLKDAGEAYATEVMYCDEGLLTAIGKNCSDAKTDLNTGVEIKIEQLKTYELFTDDSNNCTGSIKVQANTEDDEDQKITVTLNSDVKCNNQ